MSETALDYNKIAGHFEFLAKMLRGSKTVRVVNADGSKSEPIPTWRAAAEEAEQAAQKIRSAMQDPAHD